MERNRGWNVKDGLGQRCRADGDTAFHDVAFIANRTELVKDADVVLCDQPPALAVVGCVLASTKASMDGPPRVTEDQNFQHDEFAAESLKVKAYWVAHLTR